MQKLKFILAFLFLPAVLCGQEFDFTVSFYNTQIPLRADSGMLLGDQRMSASAENVNTYYHAMVIAPVDPYIASLKKQRKKNGLNDWLMFDLMQQSAEVLFPNASQNFKTLFLWYIASEIGWDLELYLAGHNASILVRTKETLYERDFYKKDDIYFVKIYPDEKPRGQDFKYQRFIPPFDNTNAAPFSFLLDSLPVLKDEPVNRDLTFIHDDKSYSVSIKINQNALDLTEHYPIISQDFYFTVPLSHLALNEIKKAFSDYLKIRTVPEGLIFLLSFVRTAFIYEPDMIQFRRELPFTAEQTLFFAKSDCEDRSALFFQLVKTFYPEIPMIVLEFPEHVTVGVALPEASSLYPVMHKNRRYYICEPTNPGNELKLGQTTLAGQNYKIIYDWEPQIKKSGKR